MSIEKVSRYVYKFGATTTDEMMLEIKKNDLKKDIKIRNGTIENKSKQVLKQKPS